MIAIGFLLILLGIGAIVDGYHGHPFWSALVNLFGPNSTALKSAS